MQALLVHLKHWVWVVCVAWSAVQAAPSPDAGTPPAPFASWLDTSGTADLAAVQQQARWEPFTGWQGWAYGPQPVWLRVHVPAAKGPDAPPFILVVRPHHLDHLTLYDPAIRTPQRLGDFHTPADDALGGILYAFRLSALTAPREVYLKLQSTSSRVVHLSLLPLPQAQAYSRWVEWVTGCVWILSVVFLVWATVQWLLTRDRVMGFLAIKQAVIALWGFLFLGFARVTVGTWFPEGMLSLASSVVAAGAVASVLWFFEALLVEYNARPPMRAVLRVGAWAYVGLGLLNFLDLTRESLQMINAALPLALVWIVLTLVTARPLGAPAPIPKALLLGYLFLYAFLNSLPALTHVGLIPESPILFIGNMSVMVVDGLVMLVILNVRQRRLERQHQAVSAQLMLQQEQARLDQQYLDDQRKLLAMLAHEMKTPLANLRIWMEAGPQGRDVMERAIHDMNRVIERCVHTGQLADQRLQPRNEWLDAGELTQAVLAASRQPGRVKLELPPDVCAVQADAQMLSIVLGNVLENAYKYSVPDASITLRLEAWPGHQGVAGWRWQVDNPVGTDGFPDGDKVFDKYYRSPSAQRQSGSGLGLFLVKSLLELMRGHVRYIPLPQGVRFQVWLPREALAFVGS